MIYDDCNNINIKKHKFALAFKKVTIIITLVAFIMMSSGCFDQREIDELAYVMAVGFDMGVGNSLRMTLQLAVPTAVGGGGGGSGGEGGGGGSKSVTTTTVEVPTLYTGLNVVNSYVSKQINLSHAKVAVFSEELAKNGMMQEYLHAIIRGREFRPNMYIAVARGSAEEYIKNIKPTLEVNPAKYYELTYNSSSYTGFTPGSQLHDFHKALESLSLQPVAILAGVSKFKSSDEFKPEIATTDGSSNINPLGGDYLAGDLPKVFDVKAEIMGMAVFNREKMVGELDGSETEDYLMLSGRYKYSYITIPDPKKEGSYILMNIRQSRAPVSNVDISNSIPRVHVVIRLEADILSIQSGYNYEALENTAFLEQKAEEFIKEGMMQTLNKVAKEYKSDIFGFGSAVSRKFLTWEQWKNYNWPDKFKDSEFDVNIDLKIRRPGLIIRSMSGEASQEVRKK